MGYDEIRVRVLDKSVAADISRLQDLKDSLKVYYDQVTVSYSDGNICYQRAINKLKEASLEGERYDRYCTSADSWLLDAETSRKAITNRLSDLNTIIGEINAKIDELEPKKYYYEWRAI